MKRGKKEIKKERESTNTNKETRREKSPSAPARLLTELFCMINDVCCAVDAEAGAWPLDLNFPPSIHLFLILTMPGE